VVFDDKIYNGYGADVVGSRGALRNDVRNGSDSLVGRGVLLDLPRTLGVPWLEPGTVIGAAELDQAVETAGVTVSAGDILLVRTGQIAQVRADGAWGDYVGGSAPGLGLSAVEWLTRHDIAAVATDTFGLEVRPNETADVMQPLHIVLLVHVGMWLGEIFDLEVLAADCADDGVYEFLFCGPPLPFSRAVGSPLNPMAVK
jgi:kynurenine formamidase